MKETFVLKHSKSLKLIPLSDLKLYKCAKKSSIKIHSLTWISNFSNFLQQHHKKTNKSFFFFLAEIPIKILKYNVLLENVHMCVCKIERDSN